MTGQTARHRPRVVRRAGIALLAAVAASCAPSSETTEAPMVATNPMIALLAGGQPVPGIFSGDHTEEQGRQMVLNREADFIFYSLESGPFDIPAMRAYMQGMRDGAGEHEPQPIALRIPPIRDGADSARARVRVVLEAGVDAIVFPHVETAEEAEIAVSSLGAESWPSNAEGRLVNIVLIEDQAGIARASEIAETPGVSVVIPGPDDLRRAYEGDMEAVENAIQITLAACKAADVACGITAGVDDIGERFAQGFRLIIVTQQEALAVGREIAGR